MSQPTAPRLAIKIRGVAPRAKDSDEPPKPEEKKQPLTPNDPQQGIPAEQLDLNAESTPSRVVQYPITEGIVRPMVSFDEAKDGWILFQKLKKHVLTDEDFQEIQTKKGSARFIVKSGWRKIATLFHISLEIIRQWREEDPKTGATAYFTKVRVHHPTGRSVEAIAAASTSEDRPLRHMPHDLIAMSQTRAYNRAISDMVGSGETSWEEVGETN